MPVFLKTCVVGVNFKKWLESPSGSGNGQNQADQLLSKVLKNLKYCCADVSLSWHIPESVVDYYLGFLTLISDFVGQLHTDWSLKSSGITDYTNAPGHLLGFPRSYSNLTKIHSSVFAPPKIYSKQNTTYPKKNEIKPKFSLHFSSSYPVTNISTTIFLNCERMTISLFKYHCALPKDGTTVYIQGEFSEDFLK